MLRFMQEEVVKVYLFPQKGEPRVDMFCLDCDLIVLKKKVDLIVWKE